MQPELIIFDLGNVLLRITLTAAEAFERTEYELPEAYHDPTVQARLRELHTERESGRLQCASYFETAAELVGMTPTAVATVSEAWLIEPFDGAADLLNELCGSGQQVVCLSNTNAQHIGFVNDPRHPGHLPLHKLDRRFYSFEIGAMKPASAIYAHVERETAIEPTKMLFFDDRQENIEAAESRGWQAVLVDPKADPIAQIRRVLGL